MNPFYSIIVPIYKVESYITRCIQSVLSQTFKDFELILVDDGSPDKSGQICDTFANKDKRIKVIHTCNGGVSKARNRGIQIAKGKWLVFLDADDNLYGKDSLRKMYENIATIHADIYQFQILCKDKGNQEVTSTKFGLYKIASLKYLKLKPKRGQASNYIFSNNIIKKNKIFFPEDVRISEDQSFTYSYIVYCDTIKICNVLFYVYNINENPYNSSSLANKNVLQDAIGHIYATKQIIYHLNIYRKNKRFINERIAMMILYLIVLSTKLSKSEKNEIHRIFKQNIPFQWTYLFNNKILFIITAYLNLKISVFLMKLYMKFKCK